MKPRYCRVELTDSKSTPYQIEFVGYYRHFDDFQGRLYGTKITIATHRCRYDDLKDIIDQWIDHAVLPNDP